MTPPDIAAIRELVTELRQSDQFGGPSNLDQSAADALSSLLAERETLTAEVEAARMSAERDDPPKGSRQYRLERQLEAARAEATVCLKCRTPHDGSQWASCEFCSLRRTRFIDDLEGLLGVKDLRLSPEELLGQVGHAAQLRADLARVTAERDAATMTVLGLREVLGSIGRRVSPRHRDWRSAAEAVRAACDSALGKGEAK